MVHPTDPHSCFSAAAHREYREAEAAVIEAAKAMVDVIMPPKDSRYSEYQAAAGELCVRVNVLRALEGDA
jgi:hypothetical protein